MRDYRSYENRRRSARSRRDRDGSRALLIGIGVFAAAIAIVASVLVLSGNDEPADDVALLNQATATRTPGFATATTIGSITQPPGSATNAAQATTASPSQATTPANPATATSEAEPTAEPDDGAEDTDNPSAEPTLPGVDEASPTEEPDAPDSGADDPSSEPETGDFGRLPAADLPSGGIGRDLVLNYELAISPEDVPTSAVVYHMLWEPHSAESAGALANSLGVHGEVTGSDGYFRIEGSDSTLVISGQSIQYVFHGMLPPTALDDDATLIESANSWLVSHGLVLNDLGPGTVVGRDELARRASVVFYSTDPDTLLSVYPSARLTMGPGATIIEAYVIWPTGYESSVYGLRTLNDLMGDLYDGRAFIEADLSGVPGSGPVSGSMVITSVSLAYSTAGSQSVGQFLTPVVVFHGEATLADTGATIPVAIYVPGVYAQDMPRG